MVDQFDEQAQEYLAKPYTRILVPDPEDGGYIAEVLELPGCLTEGDTPDHAYAMLEDAMVAYISTLLEDGRPVPEPIGLNEYSGNIALRTSSELHRHAVMQAKVEGVSLNQWIGQAIAGRLADPNVLMQVHQAQLSQMAQEFAALKSEFTRALTASQQTMLGQVNALDQKLNQRLDAVQTSVGQSLTATTETIGKIGEQLGGLNRAAKRILEVGHDVSSLKDVLQPPKRRGGFGELMLEQLVRQVLTEGQYSTQHRFRNNTVVDLVIESPEGLVPVDSKFPIESFRRVLQAKTDEERTRARKAFVGDVKLRIDQVAKYIRPDDGTLDFALMYVPAENIYYETIVGSEDESAMTYALERNVHLCSPNTFHAFLQVVLRGFNSSKVLEEASEIVERVAQSIATSQGSAESSA